MSSHFLAKGAAASALLLAACGSPTSNTAASNTTVATGKTMVATGAIDPRVLPYLNSQQQVTEGMALYKAHNCNGCHSNGGGGMAPALMDDTWIYGGRLEDIHDTILQGRPNGMPAWKGKLTEDQVWKIAAYVRSMSLPGTLAAAKGNTPSQSPVPVPASVEAP
jgi:cytochrome c oxidase cbb3-type subunit 3